MKRFLVPLASLLLLITSGCGHVDLSREGDPNRVLTGQVKVGMDLIPPPDAELVVRLVVPPQLTSAPTAASHDLVIGESGTRERPAQIVAEQVIRNPGALPVPFRLEFRADDAQLRQGLNIEARLSWGRTLRFRNIEAQLVTLGGNRDAQGLAPQTILLEPVR